MPAMRLPKQTRKYLTARDRLRSLDVSVAQNTPGEELYAQLEQQSIFWNAARGVWEYSDLSASMFQTVDGQPTGICRLRLMADPRDMPRLAAILTEALAKQGVVIQEKSDIQYPNHRGPGTRMYLTVQLPKKG